MSTRQDFGSNFQLVRDTVYYKTVTRLYSACAGKFREYTHFHWNTCVVMLIMIVFDTKTKTVQIVKV